MIDGGAQGRVSLSRQDFALVAKAVIDRFSFRAAEAHRLAIVRELLATTAELNRTLTTHTHRALVHCQGSHGVGDIKADTDALFDALNAYATSVRNTADSYRALASFRDNNSTMESHAAISAR